MLASGCPITFANRDRTFPDGSGLVLVGNVWGGTVNPSGPVRAGSCIPCGTSTAVKEPRTVAAGLVVAAVGTVGTVVTVGVEAIAIADAVPVATAVTEETPGGTGVPVIATVASSATEVRVAAGAGDAVMVAAAVMVATGGGETVGTDWPDAEDGGNRATKRPATAITGTARRLNMRRRGWTTYMTRSRFRKARSPYPIQQFGSGASDHHDGLHGERVFLPRLRMR